MTKHLCILFLLFPLFCLAQQPAQTNNSSVDIMVPAVIYEGDTIPYIILPTIVCLDKRILKTKNRQHNGQDFYITLKRFIRMQFWHPLN